jgi:hypothetical protein
MTDLKLFRGGSDDPVDPLPNETYSNMPTAMTPEEIRERALQALRQQRQRIACLMAGPPKLVKK